MAEKTLFGVAEILHNMACEAISVTIDKEDRSKKVKANATAPDGVLLYDADVTEGDAVASLVYRGTLRADKVNGGTVSDAIKGKLPHIQFVKGA